MRQARIFGLSLVFVFLCFISKESHAMQITLDFSSGTYSSQFLNYINQYDEDGFTVRTVSILDQFSETFGSYGPTLAWYESDVVIEVDYNSGLFDLLSIDVPIPAFAGLAFESSKGTIVEFGSSTGTKTFSGYGWEDIDYFTITTRLTFDILTETDNFEIKINPIPVPSAMLLLVSGIIGLVGFRRKIKK